MKRILLSCVGERDPIPMKSGETGEGAILTLTRRLQPDEVLLLPTEGRDGKSSTVPQAELTVEEIKKLSSSPAYIRPLPIADPTDYVLLLETMRKRIDEHLEGKAGDELECLVNLSSGTGQQKAVWLLLASGGAIPNPRLYDVLSPQYAPSVDKRVRPVEIHFLEEEKLAERAVRAFREGLFLLAKEDLDRLSKGATTDDRRSTYSFFMRLAAAYHLWDLLDFREASKRLSKLAGECGKGFEGPLKDRLVEQVTVLRRLEKEERETREGLQDLYWNAKRAERRGAYTDVLARCRRLLEGVLFMRVREKGVEPANLVESRDADLLERIRCELGLSQARHLTLWGARRMLETVAPDNCVVLWLENKVEGYKGTAPDKATSYPRKAATHLDALNDLRNHSFDGHGMKPVLWQDAATALEVSRSALKDLLGVKVSSYAFDETALNTAAAALARRTQ